MARSFSAGVIVAGGSLTFFGVWFIRMARLHDMGVVWVNGSLLSYGCGSRTWLALIKWVWFFTLTHF